MIVSDAAVSDLNTVLAAGIPVFVVAYFAARSVSDNFADLDEPPLLRMPQKWREGRRYRLVDTFASPNWTPNRDIEMGTDFQTRSDRNLTLTAPSGLMASLFAIALAGDVVGRYLTAASIVLFALLVGSVVISATQANMVRLQLSKQGKDRTDPFGGILKGWLAATATLVLAVALAALVLVR